MRRRKFIALMIGGTAATWSAAARGQPSNRRMVTVGILSGAVGTTSASAAFIEAMNKLGYEQGRNLTILFRSTKSSHAELPALAAELVDLKPDVLIAMSTPPVIALKSATTAIPIVMLAIGEPIRTGLVQSLAHPGGNITGTANELEMWGAKAVQMATQMLPGLRCVAYFRNPSNQSIMVADTNRKSVGETLGIDFEVIDTATPEQLDYALARPLDKHCNAALIVPLDGLFAARGAQIADFALRQKIALFAPFREYALAGALMVFGIDLDDQWRLGASYVDRILSGTKPADLPIQQPTKFQTVINLKTAKVIGIEVPTTLLLSADEVIE